MDLQDFIKKEKALLDQFERYWEKRHKKDGANFPGRLAPSDWEKNFIAWRASMPKEKP